MLYLVLVSFVRPGLNEEDHLYVTAPEGMGPDVVAEELADWLPEYKAKRAPGGEVKAWISGLLLVNDVTPDPSQLIRVDMAARWRLRQVEAEAAEAAAHPAQDGDHEPGKAPPAPASSTGPAVEEGQATGAGNSSTPAADPTPASSTPTEAAPASSTPTEAAPASSTPTEAAAAPEEEVTGSIPAPTAGQ